MESSCVLCCDPLKFVCVGKCNHKNMCEKCTLRMRILIKDFHCPLCKADLQQIVITEDLKADYGTLMKDPSMLMMDQNTEGDSIYYDTYKTKYACTRLRELTCLFQQCSYSKTRFPNLQALKHHLIHEHRRAFCDVCLRGRQAFVREQKVYKVSQIQRHKLEGDIGSELPGDVEVDPHPYCDFCKSFYFNDDEFLEHLNRNHFKCTLCSNPRFAYVFYDKYDNLRKHFNLSHHLCPYKECLNNCFVVFKTEGELKVHVQMVHMANKKIFDTSELVGFDSVSESHQRERIQDQEGIDFHRYFENRIRRQKVLEEKKSHQLKKSAKQAVKEQEERKIGMHRAYNAFHDHLKKQLTNSDIEPKELVIHKDRYKQLWVIVKRIESEAIWDFEYLMNFGVTLDQEIALKRARNDTQMIAGEESKNNWFTHYCAKIPLHQQLIAYLYIKLAYQKMNHIYFDEKVITKNDLNLLSDFPELPLHKEVLRYLTKVEKEEGAKLGMHKVVRKDSNYIEKHAPGLIMKEKKFKTTQDKHVIKQFRNEGEILEEEIRSDSHSNIHQGKYKIIDIKDDQMFPSLGGPPKTSAAPQQKQQTKNAAQKIGAQRPKPKNEDGFFGAIYEKPSQKKKKGGGKAVQKFQADAFPELPGLQGKTPSQRTEEPMETAKVDFEIDLTAQEETEPQVPPSQLPFQSEEPETQIQPKTVQENFQEAPESFPSLGGSEAQRRAEAVFDFDIEKEREEEKQEEKKPEPPDFKTMKFPGLGEEEEDQSQIKAKAPRGGGAKKKKKKGKGVELNIGFS